MKRGTLIRPSDLRGKEHSIVGRRVNAMATGDRVITLTGYEVKATYFDQKQPGMIELHLGKHGNVKAVATNDDQWHLPSHAVTIPHLEMQ